MAKQTIVVEIQDGKVSVNADGFPSQTCSTDIGAITKAIRGEVVKEKAKTTPAASTKQTVGKK